MALAYCKQILKCWSLCSVKLIGNGVVVFSSVAFAGFLAAAVCGFLLLGSDENGSFAPFLDGLYQRWILTPSAKTRITVYVVLNVVILILVFNAGLFSCSPFASKSEPPKQQQEDHHRQQFELQEEEEQQQQQQREDELLMQQEQEEEQQKTKKSLKKGIYRLGMPRKEKLLSPRIVADLNNNVRIVDSSSADDAHDELYAKAEEYIGNFYRQLQLQKNREVSVYHNF